MLNRLNLILIIILEISQFSCAKRSNSNQEKFSDTLRLEIDLRFITSTLKSRNFQHPETLNQVADYIFSELSINCDTVYFQNFEVNGTVYKNVIGSIGLDKSDRIVIGAHYDVAGEQEGADDNASGVAGVLELSRLLAKEALKYRIDFVAYALEEPPFFRTENMGSHIHAKSLFEKKVNIIGMICLEMIGYYNDEPNSQSYPIGFLKLFYGNKGNFITVVQKFNNGKFGRQIRNLMKKAGLIKTKSFRAPAFFPGVDFSDHQNYWKFGYNAVMITNTSFYRNQNYHTRADRFETLDIQRMARVIDEVFLAIIKVR